MKLDNIEKIIIPKIEEEGFEIEYVEFVKEGDNNILRVVIDNPNGNVAIDDCEKISRKIEDDIDKNIDKEYVLEVSSAGLERQLKNIKLFEKYIGSEVYVKLYKKLDDKKEITGILKSVNDNNIVIESLEKEYIFNIKDIAVAHTIYDFDNADVLSIIGSGDQYFTAMLAGAKSVTVFDLNVNAWHHFVLKFMAIRYLSYEEFWQFFITDGLDNLKLYLKIRDYLPSNVKDFFDLVKITKLKFSNIKVKSCFMDSFKQKDYLRMLPYLNEENYYKLQELLKKRKLPNFIIKDFSDISFCSSRLSASKSILNGTRITNVVPTPSSLSKVIVPPIFSISFLVMGIPRPVPAYFVRLPESSCAKGSKIRFWNASDIPIPVSRQMNSIVAISVRWDGSSWQLI